MTGDELSKELAKSQIRPAYLLVGEEALLRDDALALLRRAVLAEGSEDFNLDKLAGEATSAAALRDTVCALPVLSQYRLVVLREPDQKRGPGKDLTESLADIVAEVLSQEQTVLVVAAEKADKRSRWVKAFKEPAATVTCDPPRNQRSLVSFVKHEAKRQGVKLENGAAELLTERIGSQLMLLRQEIAKASLLAGPGETVACSHIEQGAAEVADGPIWDLTDAIGAGNTRVALAVLGRLRVSGAPPPVILGSLASHFRKLARVAAGGVVGGPPFAVRKLEQQARRYRSARLLACLRAIHQADLALKGASAAPADLSLERLVLGLSA